MKLSTIKKFFSFCIIGGLGAGIETLTLNLFLNLQLPFYLSKIFGLFSSLTFVFLTNRKITFSDTNSKVSKQLIKFIIVYSLAISTNFSVSLLLKNRLGEGLLQSNIASLIGIISGIPISFLGSNFWVFKKSN